MDPLPPANVPDGRPLADRPGGGGGNHSDSKVPEVRRHGVLGIFGGHDVELDEDVEEANGVEPELAELAKKSSGSSRWMLVAADAGTPNGLSRDGYGQSPLVTAPPNQPAGRSANRTGDPFRTKEGANRGHSTSD